VVFPIKCVLYDNDLWNFSKLFSDIKIYCVS
jgi:hypothetical protein